MPNRDPITDRIIGKDWEGRYIGNYRRNALLRQKYVRPMPYISFLTSTPRTEVTCRLCRGLKIAVDKFSSGAMHYCVCPRCNGTGRHMSAAPEVYKEIDNQKACR